ncbi:MAG TPA: protein translocase subunit SecD [Fimbriiglobus sp.]|nr:protein translocase subunit SecD [Fimbriiglobus sp.]
MRRNFLLGLAVCLVPALIAGLYVVRGFARESREEGTGFRRGIDLAGGTILVYEVDVAKTEARKHESSANSAQAAANGLSSDDIRRLAENLKRRIDPADLRNVIVRPVGTTRVEIILPFTGSTSGEAGATEDFVQDVKNLVGQVGVLEFRILANNVDDAEAIRDAQRLIEEANTDPAAKARAKTRAEAGLPPEAPAGEYKVLDLDGVTYEWVELGKETRESLHINNAAATDPTAGPLWHTLAQTRGHTYLYHTSDEKQGRQISYLLTSRDFAKTAPTKDERDPEKGIDKKVEYFVLARVSPQDSLKVDRSVGLTARSQTDQRTLNPAVGFGFNATGAQRLKRMTERNRPTTTHLRNMAIIMDDKVVSMPYLGAVLSDGGEISGNFTQGEVNRLVYILRSGALNAELKPDPVSENTVGPTLGRDTIRKGLEAVGLSFAAVMIFMVIYYRFAGLVACVALFINLLLTVGFMVMVNAAFTLPGLAGIVLMLGMAVDANVLIYERIREERERGANLLTAVRNGYDRAFPTIIDTHLTSIFTAIVLYTFGNDNLKGFAVSLTVGLIISLYTALYVTRLIFDYWMHRRWLTQLRMMRLFARPSFDFMRIRHYAFGVTGTLTVLGLALFLARGDSVLNVDFTKGTLYGGRLKEGEARPLSGTVTVNGQTRTGLLDLLGEQRQADRLAVKPLPEGVVWLTPPVAGDENTQARAAEYVYKITYADGAEAVVTLANPPEGATEQERLEDLRQRASQLPGLSAEQVFLAGQDRDLPPGTSRSFTVRTTEREPELVQASLDRLLRDQDGHQLLEAVSITGVRIDGPVATVTLDRPASPGYLKRFVERELKLAGRYPAAGGIPALVTGVPTPGNPDVAQEEGRTGKYTTIRVDVSQNSEFRSLKEASDALGAVAGAAAVTRPEAAKDEAAFAAVLAAAEKAFEARPIPDRLETFDPTLAADTANKALYAIFASWLAILGYLWFRFGSWTFGLAAVLCLVHDLCFTLGIIAACHYIHDNPVGQFLLLHDFKIDLTAVAALLTLIGYSVNDTIVVFDRIKEVRGKNPALTPQMINDSVNGTLSRTVLASVTVFLVVGVLYLFGGEGVHLFSFVMVVGVVVGTYSSIYVASPLLLILGEGKPRAGDRRVRAEPAAATTA